MARDSDAALREQARGRLKALSLTVPKTSGGWTWNRAVAFKKAAQKGQKLASNNRATLHELTSAIAEMEGFYRE